MVKTVVILGFLVAFSAGLVVGFQARRDAPVATGPSTTRPTTQPRGMAAELKLSADQQEQMKQIWSEVARRGRGDDDAKRDHARNQRDAAIIALLSPEQKENYDAIQKAYREQLSANDREMRSSFDRAVERTKEMLTPEQRVKYDEMLARRGGPDRGDRGGPDRGGLDRGGPDRGGPDRNGNFDRGGGFGGPRGERGQKEGNRRGGDDRATSQPHSKP